MQIICQSFADPQKGDCLKEGTWFLRRIFILFFVLYILFPQISYANVLYDCPGAGPEIWRGKNNGIPPARTFHLAHEVTHLK